MNDGDIAKPPNEHIVGAQCRDADRPRGLGEKPAAIDQCPIGIGAAKLRGENFLESSHVAGLYGGNVVAVEIV